MSISLDHLYNFYECCFRIISQIDINKINTLTLELKKIRVKKGRLFCIGVGGSAANSSHMVNDFRKLCNIEAYSPTDNISELTARINDDGWESAFSNWLAVSKFSQDDCLMVFLVGGGDVERGLGGRDRDRGTDFGKSAEKSFANDSLRSNTS